MKNLRSFMIGVAIVLALVAVEICISGYQGTMSDTDLVMEYFVEECGEGNYEVVINDDICNDEFIHYVCRKDGVLYQIGSINRDYYTNRYCK